jgi:hypothetical protein
MRQLPASFLPVRLQETLDLEKGMQTIEDMDRVIHGEAGVRIYSKTGRGNATISAWPSPRVIYMHPDWLDEGRATDAEVKACLMHELGHRKDWVFTAISLLASAGLLLTALAVL